MCCSEPTPWAIKNAGHSSIAVPGILSRGRIPTTIGGLSTYDQEGVRVPVPVEESYVSVSVAPLVLAFVKSTP